MTIKVSICSAMAFSMAATPALAQQERGQQVAGPAGYTVDPETCQKMTEQSIVEIIRDRDGNVVDSQIVSTTSKPIGLDEQCAERLTQQSTEAARLEAATGIIQTILTNPNLETSDELKAATAEYSENLLKAIYADLDQQNRQNGVNLDLSRLETVIDDRYGEGSVAEYLAQQDMTATYTQNSSNSYTITFKPQ